MREQADLKGPHSRLETTLGAVATGSAKSGIWLIWKLELSDDNGWKS